ncbi:MAG: VWA domain-containing protein [Phycisphaerae bacterium]|nr:VWA domain-containing protein [Phycisphaerae bacterium]
MLSESTETIQQFAYTGRFSSDQLIGVGIVLGIIIVLLTWRESRRVSWWLLPILGCLRLGALALALWILAEPSVVTKTVHRSPKSLTLLVDTSASMDVVEEPEDSATALRWAVAADSQAPSVPLAELDGAAAAMSAACRGFAELVEASQLNPKKRLVAELAEDTQEAVATAIDQLRRADSEALLANRTELRQMHRSLRDSLLPELKTLAGDAKAGRLLFSGRPDDRFSNIADALAGANSKIHRLADSVAADWAAMPNAKTRSQEGMTRIERVAALLDQAQNSWLEDISQQARVSCYRFDSSVWQEETSDWRKLLLTGDTLTKFATDLTGALGEALKSSGGTTQAVVLLTDGAHNIGDDPRKMLASMSGLPVYIVPIGNTRPVRDVILHHIKAPRSVFENDHLVIEATVDAHQCAGEELEIELFQKGQVIDSRKMTVPTDSFAQRVIFTRKAEKIGRLEFSLKVTELPDEKVSQNNEAKVSVDVIEGTINVLLAEEFPRWEFRYLYNLFDRDERIVMNSILFEPARHGGRVVRGERLPSSLEAWSRYRVAILGDLSPGRLGPIQQDLLEQYVSRRGGTLIVLAGKNAMPAAYMDSPFGQMIPVERHSQRQDFSRGMGLFLTAQGRSTAALKLSDDPLAAARIWSQMGRRIYALSEYSSPKPTSRVLIAAVPLARTQSPERKRSAFLCWQYYGRGRVVYISAPVTYQLRMRKGDRYHHKFWAQLLRWAVAREMGGGSKTVHLSTDKTRYEHEETVEVVVEFNTLHGEPVSGASARVLARDDQSIVASVDLVEDEDVAGRYHASLEGLPSGLLSIQVEGATVQSLLASEAYGQVVETSIDIDLEKTLELRNTRCNLSLLNQIAESTAGQVIPPTALKTVISGLDLSPKVSHTVSQQPLWAKWTYLWLFLGLLTSEWIIRKLFGLA